MSISKINIFCLYAAALFFLPSAAYADTYLICARPDRHSLPDVIKVNGSDFDRLGLGDSKALNKEVDKEFKRMSKGKDPKYKDVDTQSEIEKLTEKMIGRKCTVLLKSKIDELQDAHCSHAYQCGFNAEVVHRCTGPGMSHIAELKGPLTTGPYPDRRVSGAYHGYAIVETAGGDSKKLVEKVKTALDKIAAEAPLENYPDRLHKDCDSPATCYQAGEIEASNTHDLCEAVKRDSPQPPPVAEEPPQTPKLLLPDQVDPACSPFESHIPYSAIRRYCTQGYACEGNTFSQTCRCESAIACKKDYDAFCNGAGGLCKQGVTPTLLTNPTNTALSSELKQDMSKALLQLRNLRRVTDESFMNCSLLKAMGKACNDPQAVHDVSLDSLEAWLQTGSGAGYNAAYWLNIYTKLLPTYKDENRDKITKEKFFSASGVEPTQAQLDAYDGFTSALQVLVGDGFFQAVTQNKTSPQAATTVGYQDPFDIMFRLKTAGSTPLDCLRIPEGAANLPLQDKTRYLSALLSDANRVNNLAEVVNACEQAPTHSPKRKNKGVTH